VDRSPVFFLLIKCFRFSVNYKSWECKSCPVRWVPIFTVEFHLFCISPHHVWFSVLAICFFSLLSGEVPMFISDSEFSFCTLLGYTGFDNLFICIRRLVFTPQASLMEQASLSLLHSLYYRFLCWNRLLWSCFRNRWSVHYYVFFLHFLFVLESPWLLTFFVTSSWCVVGCCRFVWTRFVDIVTSCPYPFISLRVCSKVSLTFFRLILPMSPLVMSSKDISNFPVVFMTMYLTGLF
jgi:hypothetical protein